MKRNLLIGLALSSFISTSFALEINNGKLLSHKEWVNGDIVAAFNDQNSAKKHKLFDNNSNDQNVHPFPFPQNQHNAVSTQIKFYKNAGIVGEKTKAYGFADIQLGNFTYNRQIYTVLTAICLNTEPRTYRCGYSEDKFSLDNEGYAVLTKMPSLEFTYQNEGAYPVYIYTRVIKDPDSNTPTLFDSYSKGMVEIVKAQNKLS